MNYVIGVMLLILSLFLFLNANDLRTFNKKAAATDLIASVICAALSVDFIFYQ